jgi:glutamate-1-semialdehyde 2,1-aminomutase
MQGELGITPDLTTLGKYITGGLPGGAFGGRREIMDRYDPKRSDGLRHAGTFNNNICSMMAGLAGLTRVFTAARARAFLIESENFRLELNAEMRKSGVPMTFTGLGSLFALHFTHKPISAPKDITPASRRLVQVFHLECLLKGVLTAYRGDVFLSLAATDAHRSALRHVVLSFAESYRPLIERELAAA